MKSKLLAIGILFLAILSVKTTFAADGDDNLDENAGIIKGKVTTNDGKPAAAVTVLLKETGKTILASDEGGFAFRNIKAGEYTIEISLVGYETLTKTVSVTAGKTTNAQLKLTVSEKQLESVAVIASRNRFSKKGSEYVAKVALNNLENAQVYTTITKDVLNQQLIFSIDDAMKNAPGVQKMWDATGRGGDGGAYYNMRGFIVQSQLRNGIAGNVTSRIDAANLENIEVIKGPSATLFGSTLTSYGGLINRVTKKPYDRLGGELTYATGSYGFNRLSADINTPLDSAKNLLFRLNTAYNYEGSFMDNGFSKGYVIAPSVSYKVNDKLSFLIDAELYGGSNSSQPFIFFYFPASQLGATRADQLGIDYKRSYSANSIYQTYKSTNLFGQMTYKMSDKWTSQTNITTSYSFSNGPYAYFYLIPNSIVTGNPSATGADYLARADQSTANSEMRTTEIQQNFIGDFKIGNVRNRFVAGLDYFEQNSNQLFYGLNFDTIPKNGTIPNYEHFNGDKLDSALKNGKPWTYPSRFKTNTYSAYVSDVVNITDNLIASAALRIDYFDNKGSLDMTTGKYSGNYTQTALSPKFGLVYQPVKDVISVFGNYQNGFTNKTGTDFNNKTFKPEKAMQWETGVKVAALGGKLNGTISYYNIKVSDMIRADMLHPNFSIQDGTQVSKGIEVDVNANPAQGLNVLAGFAYNDSKMTEADADVQGRRPATASSPYTANLWIGYKIPHGKAQGLGFGFGGNYASDNKILNSVYYGEFILPAYTILNASVFYEATKFRVGVKVDNLTNKEYWTGYTTMNPQKLRSITGSVSFKF